MCRMMGYLGRPVRLDQMLYAPDSSLLRQTVGPRMLDMLNLAGFGLAAWSGDSEEPELPWLYHTPELPLFDRNLQCLARKVRAHALLAHIRGVPLHAGARVHEANLHPFRFPGARLAMAHNGDLADFAQMRFELVPLVQAEPSPAPSALVPTTALVPPPLPALTLSPPASPALEVLQLVAVGRGFGHGIGMSQWGALGLARQGESFAAILRHYYRGAQLRPYGQLAAIAGLGPGWAQEQAKALKTTR